MTLLILALTLIILLASAAPVAAATPKLPGQIARQITALRTCQTALGLPRAKARSPWVPHTTAYRRWQLNLWTVRKKACVAELHRVAQINRNLYNLAVCETGGINGGQPLWTHHNSVYTGALGFAHGSWRQFKYDGMPAYAAQATPGQQLRVGRRLVELYGYSPWPACSTRLGLR